MQLGNGQWHLSVAGDVPPGGRHRRVRTLDLELTGPTHHVGHAVRRGSEAGGPAASPNAGANAGATTTRPAGIARAR
jgi:hypothetical protein